jgi:hypothetical protein
VQRLEGRTLPAPPAASPLAEEIRAIGEELGGTQPDEEAGRCPLCAAVRETITVGGWRRSR